MKKPVQRGKKTFCIQCGTDLDDFWLSPNSQKYADLLKNHFECQRTGKFQGSMCSKLFIAGGFAPVHTRRTSKLIQKRVTHLKHAVMKKIAAEQSTKR